MITITEALSEVNLLKKKIQESDQAAKGCLVRVAHVQDPYEKHGGSVEQYAKSTQSSNDLRRRLVDIRSKISKANIENQITINDQTMSIFDWLTWKREIYPELLKASQDQIGTLRESLAKEANRPEVWKDENGNTQLVKYVRNADLKLLEDKQNRLVDTYGKLDGQLSLRNATITIQ